MVTIGVTLKVLRGVSSSNHIAFFDFVGGTLNDIFEIICTNYWEMDKKQKYRIYTFKRNPYRFFVSCWIRLLKISTKKITINFGGK